MKPSRIMKVSRQRFPSETVCLFAFSELAKLQNFDGDAGGNWSGNLASTHAEHTHTHTHVRVYILFYTRSYAVRTPFDSFLCVRDYFLISSY